MVFFDTFRAGYSIGYSQGFGDGYAQGYMAGYQTGYAAGYKDGQTVWKGVSDALNSLGTTVTDVTEFLKQAKLVGTAIVEIAELF